MTIDNIYPLFKRISIAMILAGAISCSSFFSTPICDIYENTQHYQDKEITIKGKVETTVSIFGLTGFIVNDGTGTILVVGSNKAPSTNSQVTVKGTISVPVKILDKSIIIFNAVQLK